MLTLYISEVLDQTRALVFSNTNPVPISLQDLTFGDSLPTQLFIVDGSGGYSTASGAEDSTVVVSIGSENIALYTNPSWTILAGPPTGWTGTINPTGAALLNLFNGRTSMVIVAQVQITDALGNARTYLTVPFTLLNAMAPTGTVNKIQDGNFPIPNGGAIVFVSGLGCASIPKVKVNIQKPIGGLNIFGTVVATSITTDGFQVDLSGITDSANYVLTYQLTF